MRHLWLVSTILNCLMGGEYPETLSSRCWRNQKHWWFRIWYRTWNAVFCDETHCVESYLETQRRKAMEQQLNLPFVEETTCAYCGTKVLKQDAHKTQTNDYCCQPHAVAHNLDRLAQEWD